MDLAELKEAGILALSDSLLLSIGYISKLQENGYGKITIILLELLVNGTVPREQVDGYLTHLRVVMRRQRGTFEHCLGIIRTPPIQEGSQYRIQCVLIFNGERVRRDIKRGHEVGRYWVNIITEEQGGYCNYNSYRQLNPDSRCGVVELGTMRWKCHMLLLSMVRADYPLILVDVPAQGET